MPGAIIMQHNMVKATRASPAGICMSYSRHGRRELALMHPWVGTHHGTVLRRPRATEQCHGAHAAKAPLLLGSRCRRPSASSPTQHLHKARSKAETLGGQWLHCRPRSWV